mmetsp:Transcript_53697/g.89149  ORF Transcript_53697/g.89149 Transcript_53697/m.89149 type:complete len:235 (+) Transcript_53697:542-1246(+)
MRSPAEIWPASWTASSERLPKPLCITACCAVSSSSIMSDPIGTSTLLLELPLSPTAFSPSAFSPRACNSVLIADGSSSITGRGALIWPRPYSRPRTEPFISGTQAVRAGCGHPFGHRGASGWPAISAALCSKPSARAEAICARFLGEVPDSLGAVQGMLTERTSTAVCASARRSMSHGRSQPPDSWGRSTRICPLTLTSRKDPSTCSRLHETSTTEGTRQVSRSKDCPWFVPIE